MQSLAKMNRNQSRRLDLFTQYNANLRLMANHPHFQISKRALTGILCPICMEFYDSSALEVEPPQLTLDHIPPSSSGGKNKDAVLVCARCNNEAGAKLDHHLADFLQQKDVLEFVPGSHIDAKFSVGPAKHLVGTLKVTGERELSLNAHEKRINPATLHLLDSHIKSKRGIEPINFQIKLREHEKQKLDVGLLRIAYLIYFRWLGYSALLHPNLDPVRRQILDPTGDHLINRWNVTGLNRDGDGTEGIDFVVAPLDLRCVLIRFSLKTALTSRAHLIALPSHLSPGSDIYQAIDDIQGKDGGLSMKSVYLKREIIPYIWKSPNGYQAPYYYADYRKVEEGLF